MLTVYCIYRNKWENGNSYHHSHGHHHNHLSLSYVLLEVVVKWQRLKLCSGQNRSDDHHDHDYGNEDDDANDDDDDHVYDDADFVDDDLIWVTSPRESSKVCKAATQWS